ncbi:MAG TPA: hypothetical protein VE863_16540 [Pyrinomonadaceae bacterium]|jgi:hypothetical protein|nr:hypothetical protein [Pyrinomonadaceae bacterium]
MFVILKNLKLIIAPIGTLCFALTAFGQGSVDENGVYRPTEQEIANNKRLLELWKHPTFVTLRLISARRVTTEEPSTTPAPYNSDERMVFQLFITQNSTETLPITSSAGSLYRGYRPNLLLDGDEVRFSSEAQRNIEEAARGRTSGSVSSRFVEPGQERSLGQFSLDDWYDWPLKPGHYQLTFKRRFAFDGDWVESNPVTFDVVPRKPPTPVPAGFSLQLVIERPKEQVKGQPYHLGYDDGLAVDLVNDSDQRVPVSVVDKYYGHRPQLTKDGSVIPYSDEVTKLIESKEKDTRLVEVVNPFFLDPKTTQRLDGFSLKQWYGPLAPGIYHLTYRRRFEIGGQWTSDSPELVFELSH